MRAFLSALFVVLMMVAGCASRAPVTEDEAYLKAAEAEVLRINAEIDKVEWEALAKERQRQLYESERMIIKLLERLEKCQRASKIRR